MLLLCCMTTCPAPKPRHQHDAREPLGHDVNDLALNHDDVHVLAIGRRELMLYPRRRTEDPDHTIIQSPPQGATSSPSTGASMTLAAMTTKATPPSP